MASPQFHPLTIRSVQRLTPQAVRLDFLIPEDKKDKFRFIPGQYITLKTSIDGQEVRRAYSICSDTASNELSVGIKEVEGGRFSTYANKVLKAGDSLEVMEPTGNFYREMNDGHYMAVAAGSGITPIMSIISAHLRQNGNLRFTLVYGNKTRENIMFAGELDELSTQYGDRLKVVHHLSREQVDGFKAGRIEAASVVKDYSLDGMDYKGYFLCGPGDLITSCESALMNIGVTKERISTELFSTPTASEPINQSESEVEIGPEGSSTIKVVVDGETVQFELTADGDTILDAGLDAGADLPFACKGGVCCTCRAKITEGKVHMEQNFSLGDKELADGYVLTCQSHPLSQMVTVDFDA